MTREEFYNEIMKLAPSEYDANKYDFKQHLANQFGKYIDLLYRLDKREYRKSWGSWDEKKKAIIDLISVIKEVVNYYYEGRHSFAFTRLRDHINEISSNNRSIFDWNVSVGSDFYRMRMFDEGEKHDCNGMFHIPFDKRTIVKTQRYSAPGYPCLYLGTSAYVCWEEMLRPNLDKCYVARFHANDSIFVYDMSFPSENKWNFIDAFRDDLLRLPFVIASMVKVAKPKDTFKPEYIIPQLLMEWVIEERQNPSRLFKDLIQGIAYTSVQKSDDFDFNPDKSINFVFPAFPPFKGKYSKKLCEMFLLTEPTCDELERAKLPYQAIERDEKMTDLEYKYQISTFGQLEKRLKENFPLKRIRSK